MTRKTGGGRFNPDASPLFFGSTVPYILHQFRHQLPNLLAAVNYIGEQDAAPGGRIDQWTQEGRNVLIDSGVFSLTMAHARKHGIPFYEALGLPVEAVPGFDTLQRRYEDIVSRFEPGLWGYVEIDQGGPERKTKRREDMEAGGLRPFPVYHSLTDGLDYFDFLAERYDRICVANLVETPRSMREKVLATIWERRKRFPTLRWIHLLGYTPDGSCLTYPVESADASSFLAGSRWGAGRSRSLIEVAGALPSGFNVQMGQKAEPGQGSIYEKAHQMAGYCTRFEADGWGAYLAEQEGNGLAPWTHAPWPDGSGSTPSEETI